MLNHVLTPTPIYNIIERRNGLIWNFCNVKSCADANSYLQYNRKKQWFELEGL